MSVRTILYLWEDKRSLGDTKFGDHTIEGDPSQNEIERDTKAYIRSQLSRAKYVYDAGDIIVHWIIDVTDYAKSVGKNYPHAKLDDYIANEKTNLKHYRILADFYKISADELTRKVNEVVYGSAKVNTYRPHTFQQHAIDKAVDYLALDGRLAIISFHSIEDRIVKLKFRELIETGQFILVNKKPITASDEELEKNPRARSAKLRIISKVENSE